jgi:superfamily I DNA/RNA helicase
VLNKIPKEAFVSDETIQQAHRVSMSRRSLADAVTEHVWTYAEKRYAEKFLALKLIIEQIQGLVAEERKKFLKLLGLAMSAVNSRRDTCRTIWCAWR